MMPVLPDQRVRRNDLPDGSCGPVRLDPSTGTIDFEAESTAGGPSWSLCACGDWCPPEHAKPGADVGLGLYGDLLEPLRDSDLRLVNLETVLGRPSLAPVLKDGPCLLRPTALAETLAAVPFDVACLANNHTLDFGVDGLASTLEALNRARIAALGAGANAEEASTPVMREVKGVSVAVLNVAEGEEGRASITTAGVAPLDDRVIETLIPAWRTRADVVIVVAHAGREFLPVPAPHVSDWYRRMIDLGADVVIGHHPHVPQGLERWGAGLIAYSLGNFLMPMDTTRLAQIGCALSLHFRGARLSRCQVWPFRIHDSGLALLQGDARGRFLEELTCLSHFASDDSARCALWSAYADVWWEREGAQELAEAACRLGGWRRVARGGVVALLDSPATTVRSRLSRRVLWRLYHSLHPGPGSDSRSSPVRQRTRRGATVFRNRLETRTHRELYLTALERISTGAKGRSSLEDQRLVRQWLAPPGD